MKVLSELFFLAGWSCSFRAGGGICVSTLRSGFPSGEVPLESTAVASGHHGNLLLHCPCFAWRQAMAAVGLNWESSMSAFLGQTGRVKTVQMKEGKQVVEAPVLTQIGMLDLL